MVVKQLAVTALFPLLTTLFVAPLLARLLGDRQERDLVVAPALALAFFVGFFGVVGFSSFPPVKITEWFPLTILPPLILFVIVRPRQLLPQLFLLLPVLAFVFWVQFRPLARSWSTAELIGWIVVIAALWLLVQACWAWFTRDEENRPEHLLLLVVIATGASLVCVLDGSALMGQMAGILAASCGGLFLARQMVPTLRIGAASYAIFFTLWAGFLINAFFFVEVAPAAVIAACLLPFTIVLSRLDFYREGGLVKRSLVLILPALIPLAFAVIFLLGADSGDEYPY